MTDLTRPTPDEMQWWPRIEVLIPEQWTIIHAAHRLTTFQLSDGTRAQHCLDCQAVYLWREGCG